ncbi:MAG: hypothetical protein AB7I33_02650 [Gemmatimonadales bacterium]
MLTVIIIVLLAVGLATLTYGWLERAPSGQPVRLWRPALFRAVAWAALGLLVANLSCGVRGTPGRPLVLLDASLSMTAAGGHWQQALDTARTLGEVQTFGDERPLGDSLPDRGRSRLAPVLRAAAASGRPVIIVTDGEIEDVVDVPPDLRAQAGVRLFPRSPMPDLAVVSVSGPGRVTTGDSIPLDIEIRATGPGADSAILTVQQNARLLAREVLRGVRGSTRRTLTVSSRALRPGDNLLTVQVSGPGNAEARDDARLHLVTVTPTPGVVLIANPPDWDSRFLYRTLREVAQLPVRGYVRVRPGQWRSMADLAAVPEADVGRAVRQADLLVVKGRGPGPLATGARGILRWPSGADGATLLDGDWYLTPAAGSPVAGAFVGQPVDSFPPAFRISPIQPAPDDWVALSAQNARRGAERPVVTGRTDGNRREIQVAVDGLWRWAFRGGSSEQAYRAWVAASASWLLGGADSVRGRARPVRAVVQNQRPVVFEWLAPGRPVPLAIGIDGESGAVQDTLHFDGEGLASIRLPVGTYRYRLEGGGSGTVAVETWSDEWLPRPVALEERAAEPVLATRRSQARNWPWLFGLCILGLAGEWWFRRRAGLR